MFPQAKISGTQIAWGRGKWGEVEDGAFGYTFDEDDSFNYAVHQDFLKQHGIEDDDLFDCIAQIEDQLGAPDEYRPAMGLIPKQGWTAGAIIVRSSTNEKVMCHFMPTSLETGTTDGYFQWFLDPAAMEVGNMTDWMAQFDQMSGNRVINVVQSPVVPSYQEACEKTMGRELNETVRERFLQKVWNYHKNVAPGCRGYRNRLESEILAEWPKLLEGVEQAPRPFDQSVLGEADPSLQPPKRWFNKMKKRVKKSNPEYDADQVNATIGNIWYHRLSVDKRKEIRGREGKSYGPANA